jgi:putative ABC transport system permease protein
MNVLQLVLKQMRQRSLSTWLTLLSILLGVALATAIMIVRREGRALFGQSDYGYDVLIGGKGSPLELVLNTVYQLGKNRSYVPYSLYEQLARPRHPQVKIAVPYAVGDSYKGQRIVGTLPKLFGFDDAGNPLPPEHVMEYRPGRKYEIAQGKVFAANRFQAVVGSDIPRLTGLKLGDHFHATHGLPAPRQTPDIHAEEWQVVGVLKRTHTASDRVIFIPLTTFYCIFEHGEALNAFQQLRTGVPDTNTTVTNTTVTSTTASTTTTAATTQTTPSAPAPNAEPRHYTLNPDGTINLLLPKSEWVVSAILVRTRGQSGFNSQSLMWTINNGNKDAMAINPASEMRDFFNIFLEPNSQLLLLISLLVTVVAAVGILVSIYNSVSARMREIAILRALGATRRRILALICIEAGIIGVLGAILGFIGGHLLAAAGSIYTDRVLGERFNWISVGQEEWIYLAVVVVLAVLAGLVPALKAYRTPVATNLMAG